MKRLLVLIFLFGCKEPKQYLDIDYPEGGYAYSETINPRDSGFYCYPLLDSLNVLDSFSMGYFGRFTAHAFNEPNLSVSPLGGNIFRLTISGAFGGWIFISISEAGIIVKTNGKDGKYASFGLDIDTMALNPLERMHFNILGRWFPIEEKSKKAPYMKKYLDSLTRLYPLLLSPAYYGQLYEKTFLPASEQLAYTEEKISVKKDEFEQWIELLNKSGYWKMLPKNECNQAIGDGVWFTLEANTKRKYNYVDWTSCPGDISKFHQACNALIKMAKMDKRLDAVWK